MMMIKNKAIVLVLMMIGFGATTTQAGLFDFHKAARDGDLLKLKRLLWFNSIDSGDEDSYTALHWACAYGRDEVVKYLVEQGAGANYANKYGKTPVMKAIEYGYTSLVKYLKSKKDVYLWYAGKSGENAFHLVAHRLMHDPSSSITQAIFDYAEQERKYGFIQHLKLKNNQGYSPGELFFKEELASYYHTKPKERKKLTI